MTSSFSSSSVEKEAGRFNELVSRSELKRAANLRQLVNGLIPNDRLPPDYFAMMRELHSIGNSLNQLARHALATSIVDAPLYDRSNTKLDEAIQRFTKAIVLLRKRE
jgi:hypothetical protein